MATGAVVRGLITMPDFDRHAGLKVHSDAGLVTAEIPLAGHASQHWLSLFLNLAAKRWPGRAPGAEAEDRPDCTWVIVKIPAAGPGSDPVAMLDEVSALISEVNATEQQSDSDTARAEDAIRNWWSIP